MTKNYKNVTIMQYDIRKQCKNVTIIQCIRKLLKPIAYHFELIFLSLDTCINIELVVILQIINTIPAPH